MDVRTHSLATWGWSRVLPFSLRCRGPLQEDGADATMDEGGDRVCVEQTVRIAEKLDCLAHAIGLPVIKSLAKESNA